MSDLSITIRQQEPEDSDALYEIYSHPDVVWGTTMLPHPSRARWRKAGEANDQMIKLVACAANQVVGNIVLIQPASQRRRHSAEIAMATAADWHGKGVGYAMLSEAINVAENWIGLSRLELQVYVDNDRAIRLYKRCGFEVEGTHKAFAYRDGSYVDVFSMARLTMTR